MFPKAWTVQRLRYLILREFYLQMQDRIPPACLTIMLKRNDTDKNGVHLQIDEELLKNVKIIAKLASTPQEMVSWFLCIKRRSNWVFISLSNSEQDSVWESEHMGR